MALLRLLRGLLAFWRHRGSDLKSMLGWGLLGLGLARSLRVLRVLPGVLRLVDTEVYRRHARSALAPSLLHFICSRHYLRKGLNVPARARLAGEHVNFEQATFDASYFANVYRGDGLTLWSQAAGPNLFRIVLKLACRLAPEGDLQLCLMLDDTSLHNISFTWVRGADGKVRPFVARNQALHPSKTEVLQRFERAFPHNAAAYFTYAALQGMARACGAPQVFGVRTREQIHYQELRPLQFQRSYDSFWAQLGGEDRGDLGISIPVPFHLTPIEQVPSKHRSRAQKRRGHWRDIEEASRRSLLARMGAVPQVASRDEWETAFEGVAE